MGTRALRGGGGKKAAPPRGRPHHFGAVATCSTLGVFTASLFAKVGDGVGGVAAGPPDTDVLRLHIPAD